MNVIVYRRVSVDEGNGVSLDAQEARCRDYARLYGLEVIDVVTDAGESARSLDRPGMQKVLARLKRKDVDGVVVAKLDRLSRSVKDWAYLIGAYFGEKAGKHLWSVGEQIDTHTASGRLVLNIFMSVAEWERETISERTRVALKHKQSKGERTGNIPFGKQLSKDGIHLEPCPAEAKVVRRMLDLRKKGVTLQGIADTLNKAGIRRRHGSTFDHQFVRSTILRNQPACDQQAN
jgi:DNA invertase Pin-like site-specific DNA recombinase